MIPPSLPSSMPWTLSPTPSAERSSFLDLLRGVALLGIVLVNVQMMSAPYAAISWDVRIWTDPLNSAVQTIVRFFCESTAFALFSLLFGAGFYRLMARRDATPGAGMGAYYRRLAMLAIFGGAHIVLLWFGDVLLIYAVCGVGLLAFRSAREKTLWLWTIGLLLVPVVIIILFWGLFGVAASLEADLMTAEWLAAERDALMHANRVVIETYSGGTFGEIIQIRIDEYLYALWSLLFFVPQILAAMLVGMILAGRGVLMNAAEHTPFYRRLLWAVLPVAVLGKGLYTVLFPKVGMETNGTQVVAIASATFGGMAMALVYVCVLREIWMRGWCSRLRAHVAAAGRMTLTHYLAQSLIATTLFYSYGMGWYGRISTWQAVALMAGVYALQIAVSPWWFRRFSHGPLEAVLRFVSYGKSGMTVPKTPPVPAAASSGSASHLNAG